MQIDSYVPITQAKAKLLDMVREIHDKDNTVAITKNGVPETVMISIEHWEALGETLAILADEEGMRQLRAAILAEKNGQAFVDLESID